jgi:tetratricopeptide (TPR) repeat protein
LLATTQVYTGESEKALTLLEQLPRTPNTIYLMGLANLRLGHREKARELLDEPFPAAMSPAQDAFLKGKAYYDATLFEDAIREYRKSRELDAGLPPCRSNCPSANQRSRQYRSGDRVAQYLEETAVRPGCVLLARGGCWSRKVKRQKR